MRAIYLLPLALLAFACTAEDDFPKRTAPREIAFRSSSAEATRAAATDIGKFSLWGWANDATGGSTMVFSDQMVERRNGVWTYQPVAFWWPEYTYRFIALATSKTSGSGFSSIAQTSFSTWEHSFAVPLSLAEPYDEDILYATGYRATSDDITKESPVSLSFDHALSQLKLRVRAAAIVNESNVQTHSVRLRSLAFKPKSSSCTFVPELIVTETEVPPATMNDEPTIITDYDVKFRVSSTTPAANFLTILSDDALGHALPYTSAPMFLVPGAAGTVSVTYELWQDTPRVSLGDRTEEYALTGLMQPGRSYYASIVLPSPTSVVTVQASMEPWGDDNDTDREILYI